MTIYPPISYCTELKLAFKGKLIWKVADMLHNDVIQIYEADLPVKIFQDQLH